MPRETEMQEVLAAIQALAQQMDDRFAAVDKRFDGIDRRFELIDKRFEAIDRRFEAIDKRFQDITGTLDYLVLKVTKLDQEQVAMTNWLKRHDTVLGL